MVVAVPKTDAEVFERYFPHVKYLVARGGISRENVEDIAMVLMAKFVEKGVLEDYDPEFKTDYRDPNGEQRTANFKTFLSGFVNSYLRHFSERDRINAYRSAISTDAEVGENKDMLFLDYMGFSVPDGTDAIEAKETVENVFKYLKESSGKNLVLFFDVVLLQVSEHGKVDVKELAELFDVTRSTIHNWLKKLREAFDACM